MSFKKRTGTITCVAGAGTVSIGLGAAYARVLNVAVFNETDSTHNPTIEVTDAEGRFLISDFAPNVDVQTRSLGDDSGKCFDSNLVYSGAMNTAIEGYGEDGAVEVGEVDIDNVYGIICKSPLLVEIESLSAGTVDVVRFEFLVEV